MCISIQDSSVLVQRSALDLLLVGFPMHNSQLTRPDMAKLATAAIKAVLRRDMSLNRYIEKTVFNLLFSLKKTKKERNVRNKRNGLEMLNMIWPPMHDCVASIYDYPVVQELIERLAGYFSIISHGVTVFIR